MLTNRNRDNARIAAREKVKEIRSKFDAENSTEDVELFIAMLWQYLPDEVKRTMKKEEPQAYAEVEGRYGHGRSQIQI
jgi:hypothetical protein